MHQHYLYANEIQQHYVFHDLLLQILVDHGIAAVFNHDDLAHIFFDIGKGLHQHPGPLRI